MSQTFKPYIRRLNFDSHNPNAQVRKTKAQVQEKYSQVGSTSARPIHPPRQRISTSDRTPRNLRTAMAYTQRPGYSYKRRSYSGPKAQLKQSFQPSVWVRKPIHTQYRRSGYKLRTNRPTQRYFPKTFPKSTRNFQARRNERIPTSSRRYLR